MPADSEEQVFEGLGLQYVPPELREDKGEVIEAAEARAIPDLVNERDIKGVFHVHTNFSDGSDGVESMAEAARKLASATSAYPITAGARQRARPEIRRCQEAVGPHRFSQ